MKKIAIIGLVLVLLGAVAAGAGFVLSGGDVSVVNGSAGPFYVDIDDDHQVVGFGSSGKAERRAEVVPVTDRNSVSYDYDAREVQTIDIEESAANIVVEPSRDGRAHLTVEENDRRSYVVSCKDGVLRVKSEVSSGVELSFGSWETAEVRLALPEGMTLDIENDAGNISISEIDLAAAELDCDAGNITLTAVTVAGKLVIGCDAGQISLSGVDAGGIHAANDTGNITMDGVSAGLVEGDCSMGEILLDDVAVRQSLRLENDCGNIQLDGVSAAGGMSFRCSLGNVSGTVSGSITDYAITSDVDLGENNLPNGTKGGAELVVEVDCGNIDIAFEED